MSQTNESNLDKGEQDETELTCYCNQCLKEINVDSAKCHHCESYQNKYIRWLLFVPVAVVLLTIVQLFLAVTERVETSKILDDVRSVEQKSNEILSGVEKREERVTKRLTIVNDTIRIIDTNIKNTEKDIIEKVGKLSQKVTDINNETEVMIELVTQKIDNQILNSEERLSKTENEFNKKNQTITDELHYLKIELSKELDKLKWRDELTILTDKSITDGDRLSFNKILKMRDDLRGAEKYKIVSSYIYQIKRFFIGIDRFKRSELIRDGVIPTEDVWTIKEKITVLLNNKNKIARFKMSNLLGKIHELEVLQALVSSIKNDNCLDVVASSVRSFSSLTGYESVDVFGGEHLLNYWNENKEVIEEKLKKNSENDSVKIVN